MNDKYKYKFQLIFFYLLIIYVIYYYNIDNTYIIYNI